MDPTKRCPLCGEVILAIAVRCRFCQADLNEHHGGERAHPMVSALQPLGTRSPVASPPLVSSSTPTPTEVFEQRFLEFAYTTDYIINAPSVAYALKISIEESTEQLEDLAARDILIREVDGRGSVFYQLPGRQAAQRHAPSPYGLLPSGMSAPMATYQYPPTALSPYSPHSPLMDHPAGPLVPPSEGMGLAALLVNALCLPGLGSIIGGRSSAGIGQLLLFLIGLPLTLVVVGFPMVLSAWIWALITGIDIMNQAKQARQLR